MKYFLTISVLMIPFVLLSQNKANNDNLTFRQKRIQNLFKKEKYNKCISIGKNKLAKGNLDRVSYYYLALSYFKLYNHNNKAYLFDRSIRYLDYSNFNSDNIVKSIAEDDEELLRFIHKQLIVLAKKDVNSDLKKSKKRLKYAISIFNDNTDYLSLWIQPKIKPVEHEELTNSTLKAYQNIAEELISLFNNGHFKSVLLSQFLQRKLSITLSPLQSNMLNKVAEFYGLAEFPGNSHNDNVVSLFHELGYKNINDDETPWCAAFMNYCAKQIGAQYPSGLRAKSWLDIGKGTKSPMPGDIIVFWRNNKKSTAGHVGMYITEDNDYVYCFGGNQADKVQICPFPKERIIQYRKLITK